MRADYPVLIDACVLANQGVCDLLLRLAESPRLFVPYWSSAILAEVRRTHVVKLKGERRLADAYQTENRRTCCCDWARSSPNSRAAFSMKLASDPTLSKV